ncbi:hypothetical protein ACFLX5_00725, partial [Chloroflexota bacterium]
LSEAEAMNGATLGASKKINQDIARQIKEKPHKGASLLAGRNAQGVEDVLRHLPLELRVKIRKALISSRDKAYVDDLVKMGGKAAEEAELVVVKGKVTVVPGVNLVRKTEAKDSTSVAPVVKPIVKSKVANGTALDSSAKKVEGTKGRVIPAVTRAEGIREKTIARSVAAPVEGTKEKTTPTVKLVEVVREDTARVVIPDITPVGTERFRTSKADRPKKLPESPPITIKQVKGRPKANSGIITWKQGRVFVPLLPPHRKGARDVLYSRRPPAGVLKITGRPKDTVHTWPKGRKVPDRIDLGMVVIDISVRKGRSIGFRRGRKAKRGRKRN